MQVLRIATAFALAGFVCTGTAQPSCKPDPTKPLIYRLDLSIASTFCGAPDAANDPSCKTFPKASNVQLHGLWPNYKSGDFPSGTCSDAVCPIASPKEGKYCKYPEPAGLYASPGWKSLGGYMAGAEKCLERHEWVKHGTCTAMTPPDYFEWALKATKSIGDRLALPEDTPITQSEFNTWVRLRLPELDGAVRLNCRKDFLSGIYIAYEWGSPPGMPVKNTGGANHFGNCSKTFIVPSKPPK